VIAYSLHQNIIDAVTGGHDVTRRNNHGSTTCSKISASRAAFRCRSSRSMDNPALNAFATGLNRKQYAITSQPD
jgi:heat shock protein HtpX